MIQVARVLLVALIGTFLATFVSAPASAASTDATVVIDRFTPIVPERGDTLRLSGRVINVSAETMRDVRVRLRISTNPLARRAEVDEIFTTGVDATTEPAGQPLDSLSVAVTAELPPNQQANFAFAIPFAEISLPRAGVYVMGVEVLAPQDGQEQRVGITRTFLPWFPDEDSVVPINLVWLWPLVDAPARTASGVLLNDQLPNQISEGGRLDTLLAVGERFPRLVSWMVDPALVQSVSAMTSGYRVRTERGVVVGDRTGEAMNWLESLRRALTAAAPASSTGELATHVFPYADVDAGAVRRADLSADVVRSVTQAVPVASTALRGSVGDVVSWAPFGRLDRRTTNLLISAGTRAFVVSSSALPAEEGVPNTGVTRVSAISGSAPALVRDSGLARALALPQATVSEALLARQYFLAESALLATGFPAELPNRTVVVGPDDPRWAPSAVMLNGLLRATTRAPWLAPRSWDVALTEPANPISRSRAGYGDKAIAAELPESYLRKVERANGLLAGLTAIVDDPAGLSDPYAFALLRAESAAWRTQPRVGNELTTSITEDLRTQIALVRPLSEGRVTFSGETGTVPVTIANDLDRNVTVGVQLVGTPQARLTSPAVTDIRIAAGEKVSVELDATVVGGRELPVRVQLLTPEGENFGDAATITLATTAYARAASVVVVLAFVAIVIFVIVGIARRIRAGRTT